MLGAIEKLIMMDTSYDMIKLCKDAEKDVHNEKIETSYMVGDEEFLHVKERCACNRLFPLLIHVQCTRQGSSNLLNMLYLWFEVL